MLQKKPYKILLAVIAMAAGLVLISWYFGRLGFSHIPVQRPFVFLYKNSQWLRQVGSNIYNWHNLALENETLKKENMLIGQRLADYKNLQSENEYLKKSLALGELLKKELIPASIFSAVAISGGTEYLINRGQDAGIGVGMVVTTEEGVLIGKILQVKGHYSHIMTVRDKNFRITAYSLESNVSGIAEGALFDGMFLKLVIQTEDIKEGETLVSSGDDFFPPALIIGKVQNIESSPSDTFKKIKIKPSFDSLSFARVIVIK